LKAKYTSTKATILKAAMTFFAYLGVLWWAEKTTVMRPLIGLGPVPATEIVSMGMVAPAPVAFPTVNRSEQLIRQRAIYRVTPVAHSGNGVQVSGDAVVKIVISPSGEVLDATLIKGPSSLKQMAEGAALRWEFEPMTEGDEPVRVESTLTFHFACFRLSSRNFAYH
jgi:hypothetical protein